MLSKRALIRLLVISVILFHFVTYMVAQNGDLIESVPIELPPEIVVPVAGGVTLILGLTQIFKVINEQRLKIQGIKYRWVALGLNAILTLGFYIAVSTDNLTLFESIVEQSNNVVLAVVALIGTFGVNGAVSHVLYKTGNSVGVPGLRFSATPE